MNQTTTYDLTLIDPDGAALAAGIACPRLPRFVHVCDEVMEMSDSAAPDTPALHVSTFTLLICVETAALYVRTVS